MYLLVLSSKSLEFFQNGYYELIDNDYIDYNNYSIIITLKEIIDSLHLTHKNINDNIDGFKEYLYELCKKYLHIL